MTGEEVLALLRAAPLRPKWAPHAEEIARYIYLHDCLPARHSFDAIARTALLGRTIVRQRHAYGLRLLRTPPRRALLLARRDTVPPRLWAALFGDVSPQFPQGDDEKMEGA